MATRAVAMITLARRRVASTRQLMQLFALTEAEARLARAVLHGATVETYARSQELAISTVRSHLRAVLLKTGTRRQVDLVTVLSCVPVVREPRPRTPIAAMSEGPEGRVRSARTSRTR